MLPTLDLSWELKTAKSSEADIEVKSKVKYHPEGIE
jgi:hypothetical protein